MTISFAAKTEGVQRLARGRRHSDDIPPVRPAAARESAEPGAASLDVQLGWDCAHQGRIAEDAQLVRAGHFPAQRPPSTPKRPYFGKAVR